MQHSGSIAAFAALGFAALASATCNTFTPDAMSGGTWGYVKQNTTIFRTSEAIDCTSDLANSDGGDTGTCSFYHYQMGLELHPSLNITASDPTQIYELVRSTAGAQGQFTDFNDTIVMNYTVPFEGIEAGSQGYYTFSPVLQCWSGTIEDCDDADSSIDGSEMEACGLLTDLEAMGGEVPENLRAYDGTQQLTLTDDVESNSSEQPQPSYDGEETHPDETGAGNSAAVVNLSAALLAGFGCAFWTLM